MINLTTRAIIFNDSGQLLLLKDRDSGYHGLPGGGVESSETPMQGLLREIKEEISLDASSKDFSLVGIEYRNNQENEEIIFIFEGKPFSKDVIEKIIPDHEIEEFKFLDISEAYKLLTPSMVSRLAIIFPNIGNKCTFMENGKEI